MAGVTMRFAAAAALTAAIAVAQDPPVPPAEAPPGDTWTIGLSAYTYAVPDDTDYVQPTLTADRGWLHFEARYNYEDLDTASLWFGPNLLWGDELQLEFTPMLGAVFGETNGIAPGYRGSIGWWQLELYSEGEILFDTEDSWDSFFYNWSELTIAPTDWLRLGYTVQRTKVYETDFDIQRGFVVGISLERVDFSAYVFNPDESSPTFVLALGVVF